MASFNLIGAGVPFGFNKKRRLTHLIVPQPSSLLGLADHFSKK
jgi:hypothetical protein